MRAPVISRFAATTVATLALGIALPLLAGGTPAFACGDDSAAAEQAPAAKVVQYPASAFIAPVPTTITAGGDAVEVGIEQIDLTGAPIEQAAPALAFFASKPSGDGHTLVNLQPEELTVEVAVKGGWKRVPLHHSCDPTLVADTASLAEPLANGHAHRYMFRIGLSAKTPAQLKNIAVYGGHDTAGHPSQLTLAIGRPKTATTPPVQTAPAPAVPAAATSAPAVAPSSTPSTAPAAAPQLASTGPSSATVPLAAAGGVLAALGGVVLLALRRRTAR